MNEFCITKQLQGNEEPPKPRRNGSPPIIEEIQPPSPDFSPTPPLKHDPEEVKKIRKPTTRTGSDSEDSAVDPWPTDKQSEEVANSFPATQEDFQTASNYFISNTKFIPEGLRQLIYRVQDWVISPTASANLSDISTYRSQETTPAGLQVSWKSFIPSFSKAWRNTV